ncbi:MAG: hypothetical protein Q8K36_05685, partial [Alphaproteobacteria bacterium]|nr:hypothetical protein [Alphaproteobacteria bacterium]
MTITATITDHQGHSATLNMFHVNLKIQEGEYAHLRILAKRQDITDHDITLFHNAQIIFKGMLVGAPHYIEPELMELLYLAKPRGNLQKPMAISYFKNVNPTPWALPYADPVHGTESHISMLPTDHGADITELILEDSMKVEQMRIPLSSIRVIVRAQWVQRGDGCMNLLPFIKKAFPNQRIVTLTGKALEDALPHMGQTLGQSLGQSSSRKTGYTVLSAKLKPVRNLADTNIPIMINGKKHHIPVAEYTGHFWLQWQCAFHQQEEVRFLLKWHNGSYHCCPDDPSHTADTELEYTASTHHIAQEYDHFFESETGKRALQQAAEQSLFKGLQSQQSHMLTVKVPFHVGVNLCVGASVIVQQRACAGVKRPIHGRIMGISSIYHANDAQTIVK